MWIMTSAQFIQWSYQNKKGDNKGKRSIWFNGKRKNKDTGVQEEHIYSRFVPFIATNFNRILGEEPDPVPGQHIAATAEAKKRSPGKTSD